MNEGIKEMNSKIRPTTPSDVRLRLSNLGTDTCNASYKMMTDTNALHLSYRAVKIISEEFAGKEKQANFMYSLACLILSCLDCPKDLQKHINEIQKEMKEGAWEIRKEEACKKNE